MQDPTTPMTSIQSIVRLLLDVARVMKGDDFDRTGEDGRSRERNARLALAAATGVVVRGSSFVVNIVSVGLLYRHFDEVTFGIWLTLTSLWMILMLVSDLGVGGGIMNETARATAAADEGRLAAIYSSGQAILVIIGVVFASVLWIVALSVPWEVALKIPAGAATRDFSIGLGLMGTGIAFMVCTGLFTLVKSGQQKAHEANLWSAGALFGGLAAVAAGVALDASFATIAAGFYITPAFVLSFALARFVLRLSPNSRPKLSAIDRELVQTLLRTGMALLLLKLLTGLTTFSDGLLISAVLGPERVQDVAVPARLFNIVTLAITMFITPLWPIYAHAMASGDSEWVRRTFFRSIRLACLVGFPLVVLFVLVHPWILQVWLGGSFEASRYIVAGLAVTCMLEAFGTACAMLLNAGQMFRAQLIMGAFYLAASLSLRVLALNLVGTQGVPAAAAVAYVATVGIPLFFVVRKFLQDGAGRLAVKT
jgi:O-antigen/teichoic acid export membrane protein